MVHRRSAAVGMFATLLVLAAALPAWGAAQLELVLQGLGSPLYVGQPRDGSRRLFVVEQGGRIRVLQPGAAAPTIFLDIASRVLSGGERGLLGLAFHPQFPTNGRFFVNYTRQPDGATVIAEYRVSSGNPNVADPTELTLLVVPQPFQNHNGGMIEFGPDGFLYIGLGDGGSANDPGNRAQNVDELLGKILRIDVDHPASASQPYSSPATNPFFGPTPGRDEIFALGLRNPFRFSFDRATGQLYVGDVGQDAFEEIDIVTAGGNYGWRVFEGTQCNAGGDPTLCGLGGFSPPVAEYGHTGGRCSITGGYVYRGAAGTLPAGAYVYGDFCTGEIFLLQGGAQSVLLDTGLMISSFGEDEAGEIYVVGLGGTVHRLVDPDTRIFRGGVFVAVADLTGDGVAEIVTGADAGGGPHVRAFDADGSPRATNFFAYPPAFTGGVRVAACDFDQPADGRAEIVTAAGPGGGPHVRVIQLDASGNPATDLASFFAYSPGFSGGVFTACGDVDGDGRPDLITGADAGGGPHVRVLTLDAAAPGGVVPLVEFFAFDPRFTGGVRVAAGDVDGSKRASIIVAAGPGGGPHVRVLTLVGSALQERASFFAYAPGFTGGVFVAAGPVLGSGPAQILSGAGGGGGPHVRAFTGTGVDTGIGFFAYDPGFLGGVRVAAGNLDAAGAHEIVTAAGPGGGPHVRGFSGSGAPLATSFFAY